MNELRKYLQELQDEGVIHQEVKSHIMYLVKSAMDKLSNEIPFEDDIAGGMRNCGDVEDVIEPHAEALLRKDLIQRFYDINGMDTNIASTIETHSIIDGHEVVLESAAYDNMGYFKGLFPDMKGYVLFYSQPTNK